MENSTDLFHLNQTI